jgi:hypothetical protein
MQAMRVLTFFMLLVLAQEASSQSLKKFRVGIGMGYLTTDPESGIGFNYDVGYRIKDNVLVGFKAESAFVSENTIVSKTIFYQYYFNSTNTFRPFAGLGAGIYTPTGKSMGGGCTPGPGFSELHSTNIQTQFGVAPRVGFDHRHFTVTVEWNLAGKSRATRSNNLDPTDEYYVAPYTDYFRNTYLSWRIGFFFGGGRKDR